MAPWSFLSGSASEAEAELPAHMEPDADKKNMTAFSIFIDGALTTIYNEASGRSKDQKALRAGLKNVLGENTEPRSHARKNSTEHFTLDAFETRLLSNKITTACGHDQRHIQCMLWSRNVTRTEHHVPAVQAAILM